MDADIDGIAARIRFSPTDFYNALRAALIESEEIAAVLTVNTDSASLGDVADDRLGWHGSAASREVAHQIAHSGDCHCVRFAVCAPRPLRAYFFG